MSWIDIVFIVIVVLCALIGIGKGTYKSLVSLFGNIFAIVIAFFLTKTITIALLQDVSAINSLVFGKIYPWINGWSGTATNADAFYYKAIEPLIASIGATGISEANALALYFSYLTACLAVFIILFILLRIVAAIIFKIIGSLINRESPAFLSRLIGFIIGGIKGCLYVVILTVIFSFSMGFSFMGKVVDEMGKTTIAIRVYDGVNTIKSKVFKDDSDTMEKLIEISGIDFDEVEDDEEDEDEEEEEQEEEENEESQE